LTDSLAELLENMEVVYLIVDAVDESHPHDELLLLLETLVTDPRFCKIQLIATSRRYHDIESVMTRISSPISMSNEEIDRDIRTFITLQLDRKFIGWRAAHKSSISDSLVHMAKGMYVFNTSLQMSDCVLQYSSILSGGGILTKWQQNYQITVSQLTISSKIIF